MSGFGSFGGTGYGFAAPAKSSPSAGGLLGNLLGDIRNAAVGIPEGVVQLAEHPIRTVETAGKSTWQDWSPLFHGKVGEWAHNTYSHPLAPLLDIATVFSGGASLGARLGAKLGEDTALGALSRRMLTPETRALHDPLAPKAGENARISYDKQLTGSPAARLRQTATHSLMGHLAPHLPSWYTDHVFGPAAEYNRFAAKEFAHRSAAETQLTQDALKGASNHAKIAESLSKMSADQAAKYDNSVGAAHAQIAAELHAGKALSDINTQKIIEPMLKKYNYRQLRLHAKSLADGAPMPHGYSYLLNTLHAEKHFAFKPGVDFAQEMHDFGNTFTAGNDVKRAARDGHSGQTLIVPTRAAHDLGHEAGNSAHFLKQLWRTPSTIWKKSLIHYSPRTVVDNAIGNWTMLAMRQGGHKLLPGIVDTVKQMKGAHAADKMLGAAGYSGHWTSTHFLDELNSGFAHSMQNAPDQMGPVEKFMQKNKATRAASSGFIPLVHTVADQPVRRIALNSFMRSAPEVQKLMKGGAGFDHAVTEALRTTPGLRDAAVNHMRSIAGDYTGLTPTEQAIRSVVPFYTWSRHIGAHAANMLETHPGRLAAMQQVSNQGVAKTEAAFGGSIPDFLKGLIPLGKAGPDGRIASIATQGLNPYASIPDIADAAGALVGKGKLGAGATLGNQLNPLLAGLVEQLSGTKLGSTQPVATHGGVIPSILTNTAEALPYATLLAELMGHGMGSTYTSRGKLNQHLYKGVPSEKYTQLLGAPRKLVSVSAAQRLAAAEQPKPKKLKKKSTAFGSGF